jgi:hypothetical protein
VISKIDTDGGVEQNRPAPASAATVPAVAQRDIADWYGFWFTADFWLAKPSWFRARRKSVGMWLTGA